MTRRWGDAYYSQEWEEDVQANNVIADRWMNALATVQHDTEGAVSRAKDKWNLIVRDRLRNETALRLTVGDRTQAVAVRVADGLPRPLAVILEHFQHAEWAILNRQTLRSVVAGTDYMSKHRDMVRSQWPKHGGPATPADIRRVHETAEAWLRLIDELRAVDRIVEINEDVLGAYYFRIPEIRLYWVAIGIFSRLLDISVESLTVVVLAHELAHAYTHLGYDIDNFRWDTNHFAHSDIRIVEGLAQFYTRAVCEQLESKIPEAGDAFNKMLQKQGPAYTSFEKWLSDEDRGSEGEIVRAGMIECRNTQHIRHEGDFVDAIERHRRTVTARHRG